MIEPLNNEASSEDVMTRLEKSLNKKKKKDQKKDQEKDIQKMNDREGHTKEEFCYDVYESIYR